MRILSPAALHHPSASPAHRCSVVVVVFFFLTDCMLKRQILETHMFIVNLKFRPPYLYETKKKKSSASFILFCHETVFKCDGDCEARSCQGFKVKNLTICDIKDRLEAGPVSILSVRCEV